MGWSTAESCPICQSLPRYNDVDAGRHVALPPEAYQGANADTGIWMQLQDRGGVPLAAPSTEGKRPALVVVICGLFVFCGVLWLRAPGPRFARGNEVNHRTWAPLEPP